MKHNDIILINKAKDLIKLYTGGYDDLRGLELIEDKLYIAFGYTGMGSTFRIIKVEWDSFIHSHAKELYEYNKFDELKFKMNSKNYFGQYIDIGANKIIKNHQYDSTKNLVCDMFKGLKFLEDLEIKFI